MKTCQYCGARIEDEKKFCTSCGAALPVSASAEPEVVEATIIDDQPYQQPMYQQSVGQQQGWQPNNQTQPMNPNSSLKSYDSGSIGWAVLGFFIPIVGIILYFVWMNDKPNSAKMSLYGALVSIGIAVLSRLTWGCAFFI